MASELENLIKATIPQNLKSNDTISKLLEIYLSYISPHQDYNSKPIDLLDTKYIINKKKELSEKESNNLDNIKDELFKIHLNEIFKVFEDVGNSEEIYLRYKEIYETLNKDTKDLTVNFNFDDEVDEEYINANSSYKTKKGTATAFSFINDIISKVSDEPIDNGNFFFIDEGTPTNEFMPYAYTVRASLYKEVFKETVIPLAHPVGFDWHFIRLLFLNLVDYYGLEETKTITDLSLICSNNSDGTPQEKKLLESTRDPITGDLLGVTATEDGFGNVKEFYTSTNQDEEEKVVIDFYAKNPYPISDTEQYGLRLVRDYDGHVVLYQKQQNIYVLDSSNNEFIYDLEIEKVELLDNKYGILEVFRTDKEKIRSNGDVLVDANVVTGIKFTEYSIFDLDEIQLRISFVGGTPLNSGGTFNEEDREWATVTLKLGAKVIGESKKFFDPIYCSKEDLINNSSDYNGRVLTDMSDNCVLNYDIEYSYEIKTRDDSDYVVAIRDKARDNFKNLMFENPEYDEEGVLLTYKDNEENTVETSAHTETKDLWARKDFKFEGIQVNSPHEWQNKVGGIDTDTGAEITNSFYVSEGKYFHDRDKGLNQSKGPDADFESIMKTDGVTNYTKTFGGNSINSLPEWVDNDSPGNEDIRVWRLEHSYEPSSYKDLEDLSYGSSLDDGTRLFDVTNTPAIYERENIGNEDYIAREDKTVDEKWLAFSNQTEFSPLYNQSKIEALGLGPHDLRIGDTELIIGDFSITYAAIIEDITAGAGAFVMEKDHPYVLAAYPELNYINGEYADGEGLCYDSSGIKYIEGQEGVDADPVNLLLVTTDCDKWKITPAPLSDNVNYIGDNKTPGSVEIYKNNKDGNPSFANENKKTSLFIDAETEGYEYIYHDLVIGDELIIGEFYITYILNPIDDTNKKITESINMGKNVHTEFVLGNGLIVGEEDIIGSNVYIGAEVATIFSDEESYMNVGTFDILNADTDDWSFGVYKNDGNGNYTLLEDNNVSAA